MKIKITVKDTVETERVIEVAPFQKFVSGEYEKYYHISETGYKWVSIRGEQTVIVSRIDIYDSAVLTAMETVEATEREWIDAVQRAAQLLCPDHLVSISEAPQPEGGAE